MTIVLKLGPNHPLNQGQPKATEDAPAACPDRAAICAKCGVATVLDHPAQQTQGQASETNPICAKCWVSMAPSS